MHHKIIYTYTHGYMYIFHLIGNEYGRGMAFTSVSILLFFFFHFIFLSISNYTLFIQKFRSHNKQLNSFSDYLRNIFHVV